MRRAISRVALLLFGVALAAGGALTILEAVTVSTGIGWVWIPGPTWLASFKSTAWRDDPVLLASVLVAILGLLVIAAHAAPQRRPVASVKTDDKLSWSVQRRSVEQALVRSLDQRFPGSRYKAKLAPRGVRWTVTVSGRAAPDLRQQVDSHARDVVSRLTGQDGVRVKVNLRRPQVPS